MDNNRNETTGQVLQFARREKQLEQKYLQRREKIACAQSEILGPAIRAMRELDLDNQEIADILEYATKVLRERHRSGAS